MIVSIMREFSRTRINFPGIPGCFTGFEEGVGSGPSSSKLNAPVRYADGLCESIG